MDMINDVILRYEAEYYVLGHFSKFVDANAFFIYSLNNDPLIRSAALLNPNGSIALVVLNTSSSLKKFDVQWNEHYYSYFLPGSSIVTFKW